MKQKIHISFHTEPSLRVAERIEKSAFHFQILLLFFLCYFTANAQQTQQPYQWQWAMKGGGRWGGLGGGIRDEKIHDIKVGTDNNYYFIATLKGPRETIYNGAWTPSTQLDGVPVPTYNTSNVQEGGAKDIFLFSTTCEGEVRWSQTIGGWMDDDAYNLVLDDQNNVYVGVNVRNDSPGDGPGIRPPLHFTETDSVPFADQKKNAEIPQEGFKTTYLVKYNSNGQLLKRVALQGDVNSSNFNSHVFNLVIGDNKLHFIICLLNGTHLDGNLTVTDSSYFFKYYLVQYDLNLNYVNVFELPVTQETGFSIENALHFAYDTNKNQYYIAGERRGSPRAPLTYDGQAIVNRSYIIAINGDNGSKKWIREIHAVTPSGHLNANRIFSLTLDNNSNVYIGGSFHTHNLPNVKIYDPADSSVTPYFFTPSVTSIIPMITKFNSSGDVQWVQSIAGFNQTAGTPGPIRADGGIAINNNEVGLGAQGVNLFWDNIEVTRPFSHQPDPMLVRFDKQSGKVLGVHDIYGEGSANQTMTAVAADPDGNYITGGSFRANLFLDNDLGLDPLISTGEADFFVAKLANSACGSGNMSTEDFSKLSFNVYPNPTTGIVKVETTDTLLSYTIYDMSGKQIKQSLFAGNNQINLENASNGVYFIVITTVEGNSGTVKVVKK